MKKTILITGSSSGIGKETALYFSKKDWHVMATMRNPDKRKTGLEQVKGIDIYHLDVTDIQSIQQVIKEGVEKYEKIDVCVNNAGYPVFGPFEASTHLIVEKQFNTNVLGLMDVIREILPVFRKQGDGIIINVSSIAGKMTFPFYSIYNSTKWAVEGFSEAMQYELKPLNIKVKLIEPGIIKTDFYDRSKEVMTKKGLTSYAPLIKKLIAYEEKNMARNQYSHPVVIAKEIYKASTDDSWKLRYPIGKYSGSILWLRKILPDSLFFGLLRRITL
jgi:short-subunit dehydrogenase